MSNPAHLIRSVFQLSIAQGLTWIGGMALAVLLPRFLGDVNLGKYTFAFAITTLIGLGADLGLATYLTREVARDKQSAARITAAALLIRVPLSLLAGAIAIISAHLLGYDELTRSVLYVLSLNILVVSVSGVVFGALQGLHRMKVLAITNVLNKLGYAGLAAALLFGGAGPFELAAGYLIVGVVTLAIGAFVLFKHLKLTFNIDRRLLWTVLVGGSPTVIFPALSAASEARLFNMLSRRAVHAAGLVTIPMALGIMLLPDKIIQLLGYPETFTHSTVPLILLAPHLPVAAIDVMIGCVLNTRDRQRQWALTGVAAAALNPLLNVIAIPLTQNMLGNGAIGAAAITTVTEVFMMAVGLRLLPAGVLNRATLTDLLRMLGAAAAMASVVFLTRELPIVVPIALGALVYVGACLMLRAVSLGELNQVRLHLVQRQASATS